MARSSKPRNWRPVNPGAARNNTPPPGGTRAGRKFVSRPVGNGTPKK